MCDDGPLNGADRYPGCTARCEPTSFCGDGVVQAAEVCDRGGENSFSYGVPGGCTPNCAPSPYCGDAIIDVQHDEQRDLGAANGSVATVCTSTCKIILR